MSRRISRAKRAQQYYLQYLVWGETLQAKWFLFPDCPLRKVTVKIQMMFEQQ
jgi:hypothetical protein